MKAKYTGHMGGMYLGYMDLGTGKVLFVESGGTYDIQAVGFNAPDLPAGGDFVPVEDEDEPEESEETTTSAPEAGE